MLATTMLQAIVYGLTSDERWAARHGAGSAARPAPAWPTSSASSSPWRSARRSLMATIAFSAQRYFESRAVDQVNEQRS